MPNVDRNAFGRKVSLMSEQPAFLLMSALQADFFDSAGMHNEAVKRGFRVQLTAGIPDRNLTGLAAIAIITVATQNALDSSFRLAGWAQDMRASQHGHLPVTIVNCSRDVSAPVRADFLRYGCYVLSQATPEQLSDALDTALVDARRRSRRGITFIFRHKLDPLMTNAGREEELPARGRLLSLLVALCQERREFSSTELATVLNCKTDQVKVYVDRLRRIIISTGRKLGISIGKHEVIQNFGKNSGYRIHAYSGGRFQSTLVAD